MQTQFERQCNETLYAQSSKDLLRKMVEFSEDAGFGRISATVLIEHSPTLKEYQFITNATSDCLPAFEDFEPARVDPLSQYAAAQSGPLSRAQSAYVNCGRVEPWERQASYGYRSGIVMGFHLSRSRHFRPNCDRSKCTTQTGHFIEDFHAFAAHTQTGGFELSLNCDPPAYELLMPTRGGLEALRWTMDRMTDWEIGCRLDLSERDVPFRHQRRSRKLAYDTKHEAVLRAIKQSLIEGL